MMMKNKLRLLIGCIVLLGFFAACDKDGNEIEDEKILTERIEDIIPKQYLDTLNKLNFKVNQGVKPPIVKGTFSVKPHVLDTSNISTDPPAYRFSDAILTLYGQNNNDFSIKMLGEHFLNDRDTSIATAISGSGNDFTIYGKAKSNIGTAYAISAILISGTLDGENIKNLQTGIIMIDDSHATGLVIKNGQARIAFDSDFITEKIADVDDNNANTKRASTYKSKSTVSLNQIID